jgi:prepilin-type N-terminal cleavage/methylation domain-containing protein
MEKLLVRNSTDKTHRVFSGFTLIEILVVMVIMVMMFAIGYANYRQFSRNQALKSVAEGVKSDIKLAQRYALSGNKPAAGCVVLDGYNFEVDTVNQEYEISPVCDGSALAPIKTVSVDDLGGSVDAISITPPAPNIVTFKVLGQGTSIASGGEFRITLTQEGTASTRDVVITYSGEVI